MGTSGSADRVLYRRIDNEVAIVDKFLIIVSIYPVYCNRRFVNGFNDSEGWSLDTRCLFYMEYFVDIKSTIRYWLNSFSAQLGDMVLMAQSATTFLAKYRFVIAISTAAVDLAL